MERYLKPYLRRDPEEKMVFLGDPRQVGRATLALALLEWPEAKARILPFTRFCELLHL